jgi:hypothetical protein
VFFIVELDGEQLLAGSAKDLIGLSFVIICAVAFFLSAKMIYDDFSRLLLMYNISSAKSWIFEISARLGAAGTEGFYIPLVAAMYNTQSSSDISKGKRKMRTQLTDYAQHQLGRFRFVTQCCGSFWVWLQEKRLSFRARHYKPSLDQAAKQGHHHHTVHTTQRSCTCGGSSAWEGGCVTCHSKLVSHKNGIHY